MINPFHIEGTQVRSLKNNRSNSFKGTPHDILTGKELSDDAEHLIATFIATLDLENFEFLDKTLLIGRREC